MASPLPGSWLPKPIPLFIIGDLFDKPDACLLLGNDRIFTAINQFSDYREEYTLFRRLNSTTTINAIHLLHHRAKSPRRCILGLGTALLASSGFSSVPVGESGTSS